MFSTLESMLKHRVIWRGNWRLATLPWTLTVLTLNLSDSTSLSVFPTPLSSHPFILSIPHFLHSLCFFCQTLCKTVSEQLFGKQQLKENRDFSVGGHTHTHPHRRLEYFPAGATSKPALITLDNAFLEQK